MFGQRPASSGSRGLRPQAASDSTWRIVPRPGMIIGGHVLEPAPSRSGHRGSGRRTAPPAVGGRRRRGAGRWSGRHGRPSPGDRLHLPRRHALDVHPGQGGHERRPRSLVAPEQPGGDERQRRSSVPVLIASSARDPTAPACRSMAASSTVIRVRPQPPARQPGLSAIRSRLAAPGASVIPVSRTSCGTARTDPRAAEHRIDAQSHGDSHQAQRCHMAFRKLSTSIGGCR